MKKAVLFLCSVSILISCKKKTESAPITPGLQEFPQSWIFTVDEAPDKYIYLRTNTANMFRKSVLQSYSLLQLAIESVWKPGYNISTAARHLTMPNTRWY